MNASKIIGILILLKCTSLYAMKKNDFPVQREKPEGLGFADYADGVPTRCNDYTLYYLLKNRIELFETLHDNDEALFKIIKCTPKSLGGLKQLVLDNLADKITQEYCQESKQKSLKEITINLYEKQLEKMKTNLE